MEIIIAVSQYPFVYFPFIIFLGLCVGSFLNVVVFRTPKIMEQEFRKECCDFLDIKEESDQKKNEQTFISLSKPHSTCPHCKTKIKPYHNIPVVSYLLLRGRCASCKAAISKRYPLVEFVTGLLTVLTIVLLGFTPEGLTALLLLWFLIALTLIDADTQLLPDHLTLPLLWLGLIANSFELYTNLHDAVWGAIAGYLALWSVYWLFKLLTGKEGMGFGDFKLLAALGAWMGWQFLPLIILLSSFVGAVIGITGIIIFGRNKNVPIPFGPYLAIAGWIALLFGQQIIDFYLTSIV